MIGFPFLNTLVTCEGVCDAAVLGSLYTEDNSGSIWLKENYPHLMSQLDAMTQQWALLPKTALRNATILKQMVDAYRRNLSYGVPDNRLSPEVAQVQQRSIEELLTFLESKVYPALQHMPDDSKKEIETDAFAEAFTEDDSGQDDRESGAEDGGSGEEAPGHTS